MAPQDRPTNLKPWAWLAFWGVFALLGALAYTWVTPEARVAAVDAVVPDLYHHTSNLLLSGTLVLIYGLLRMFYNASLREIGGFTLLVIAANYGYELLLTLWNVKDIVDAHYGAVAALAVFGLVAAIRHSGLKRPAASEPEPADAAR